MASLHWVRAVLVMLASIAVYLASSTHWARLVIRSSVASGPDRRDTLLTSSNAVASFDPPRWFELGVMILGAVCSAAAAIGPWKTS